MDKAQLLYEIKNDPEFRCALRAILEVKEKERVVKIQHKVVESEANHLLALCPRDKWFHSREVNESFRSEMAGSGRYRHAGNILEMLLKDFPELEKRRSINNLMIWRVNSIDKLPKPI